VCLMYILLSLLVTISDLCVSGFCDYYQLRSITIWYRYRSTRHTCAVLVIHKTHVVSSYIILLLLLLLLRVGGARIKKFKRRVTERKLSSFCVYPSPLSSCVQIILYNTSLALIEIDIDCCAHLVPIYRRVRVRQVSVWLKRAEVRRIRRGSYVIVTCT
jgi:hypothetical protein